MHPETTSSQHTRSTINLVFNGPIRESSSESDVRDAVNPLTLNAE